MNNKKILIKTIMNKTYYWIGNDVEWNFINDRQDVYLTLSECLIDEQALRDALKLYNRYMICRLCINRIRTKINHELWLPYELWNNIMNNINDNIKNININKHNPSVRLSFKLLDDFIKDI